MVELAVFLLLNALVFGGAALVARYALLLRDNLSFVFGSVLVGWVTIVVGLELLSLAGAIRLVPATILALGVFFVAVSCWRRARKAGSIEPAVADLQVQRDVSAASHPANGSLVSVSLAFSGVLVAWAMLDVLVGALCSPVQPISDAPIYHLYFATRWWQSGTLELVPTPFGESAAPYFPANGNVWFTWLVLPWSSELAAKVGQWPFLPLATAAVFGLARELGVSRAAAAVPAVLWGTSTLPLVHSGIADVDLIMAAWMLVASWFLLRYWREMRIVQLVAAGLACGAALGTKYIATLFVPWILLAAAMLAWQAPRRLVHLAGLAVSVVVPAAFWFVRNAVLTGNPVYPLEVELFGVPVFTGWYTRETLFASEYHIPVEDWQSLLMILLRGTDPLLSVFWVVGIAAATAVAVRRRWPALLLVGLAYVQIALFWVYNPYQTQDRFLFAAFAFLAAPVAIVFDRWPRLWVIVPFLIAWHLIVGITFFVRAAAQMTGTSLAGLPPLIPAPLPLIAISNQFAESTAVLASRGALLVAVAAAYFTIGRFFGGGQGRRWTVALAALAIAGVGVGYRAATTIRDCPDPFFPRAPQVGHTPGWLALAEIAREPVRVAYAGTNLPYYLFGRSLNNAVFYVNIDEHREFLLHDYHRNWVERGEPHSDTPTPDWDRREPDEAGWIENLRERRIDFLFVGLTNRAGGLQNFYDFEGFPIERTWADRHPEVFQLLRADSRTRLYSLRVR